MTITRLFSAFLGSLALVTALASSKSTTAASVPPERAAGPGDNASCSFNPCGEYHEYCDPDKEDDLPFPCPPCQCGARAAAPAR